MQLRALPKNAIKRGTRVLMRIDSDIPLKNGKIVKGSTWRLERALPDIRDLTGRGAVVILVGHLGRPEGKVVKDLSLASISRWLSAQHKIKNRFAGEVVGDQVIRTVAEAKPGSVVLLENVRFNDRETKDCKKFARKLANMADIYVNNAFGTCHRMHSSIHRITQVLPSYAGSVLIDEVRELSKKRSKPLMVLIGGVKLKTKLPVIKALASESEALMLGGGLALVFHAAATGIKLKIKGKEIDANEIKLAKKLIKNFDNIHLPIDYVDTKGGNVHAADVSASSRLIDIGKKTAAQFAGLIKEAETVIFNGTMGVVEDQNGSQGTISVLNAMTRNKKARTVIGGGDTVGFLQRQGMEEKFDFISTGGGAMLKFLANEKLPGLEVLKKS